MPDIFSLESDSRPKCGGWAPGNYFSNCWTCEQQFVGDKRAHQCADCAYKEADKWVDSDDAPDLSTPEWKAKLAATETRRFAHVLMELIGEPTICPDGQSLQLARFPWQRPDDASHGISLPDIVATETRERPGTDICHTP